MSDDNNGFNRPQTPPQQQPVFEEANEWSIRDYIDLVLRRWLLIGVIFVVALAAAIGYSVTRPDRYRSSGVFIIEGDTQMMGFETMMPARKESRPFEFYQALIKSSSFLNLVHSQLDSTHVINRFNKTYEEKDIWSFLHANLTLEQLNYEEMVRLSVVSLDSSLSFRIATIAMDAFKERLRQVEQEESYNVVDFVNKQKEIAWQKLEEAERNLQEFKESTNLTTLNPEDGGILQRLMQLENTFEEIETQRELARANVEAIRQRLTEMQGETQERFTDIENPQIQQLRKELSELEGARVSLRENDPTSPRLSRLEDRIDEIKSRLHRAILAQQPIDRKPGSEDAPALLTEIRQNLVQEELNLYMMENRARYYRQMIEEFKRKHPQMLESALQLAQLQRVKNVNENLYNFLAQRGEEANIKAATSTGGIRIIDDPKMPSSPISTGTRRNIMLGAVLGLGLGLGLAFLLDMLDTSIRDPEQLQKQIGLPLLGTIQNLNKRSTELKPSDAIKGVFGSRNGHSGYDQQLILDGSPRDPFVDQYRGLRTNLQFVEVDTPLDALLVTSSMPGEGKTITTANTGCIYAELGHKTLIIDADLRKPMQHNVFHLQKSPGLSDALARKLNLSEVVQRTRLPNLYLLSCGTQPPNPAEMLSSERMKELFEEARNIFDIILIDSPPVSAVTDPVLLASMVKNVMLVVRYGVADKKAVENAKQMMERTRARVHGAVLNGAMFTKAYGKQYRYAYYYDSSYYHSDKK